MLEAPGPSPALHKRSVAAYSLSTQEVEAGELAVLSRSEPRKSLGLAWDI